MINEEEVRKVYASAPQHLKAYIDSDELFDAFHSIREAHKLHLDHAGNLALAIDAVILGMKRFDELPILLREGLMGLDEAMREKVVKDVNDKIFMPLRELTKKHAEESKTYTEPPAPTSGIRSVEIKLVKEPAPPLPLQSVVEQKMPPTAAPPTAPVPPAESTAPRETPRYHGTDPYREPVE